MVSSAKDIPDRVFAELQGVYQTIDHLAMAMFEGMHDGWIGVNRRPRQERYRGPIRAIAKFVDSARVRCGQVARRDPLAQFFASVGGLLTTMESAPFPEDYYPEVKEAIASGCSIGLELAVAAAKDPHAGSGLRTLRPLEWQNSAANTAIAAKSARQTWRNARIRNAFAHVCGYSGSAPDCGIEGYADGWLDLSKALKDVGLGECLAELAYADTPECKLAMTYLRDLAARDRRRDLIEALRIAESEGWNSFRRLSTALENMEGRAFRMLAEAATVDHETERTSGQTGADDLGSDADVAQHSGLREQIGWLSELEREILLAFLDHLEEFNQGQRQSQSVVTDWLDREECDTDLKNALSALRRTGLLDNHRHHGGYGGYYLTARGLTAAAYLRRNSLTM